MKICFISNCYSPNKVGGAEAIMQVQAENLKKAGHECFVVTLNVGDSDVCDSVNEIKIYRLKINNIYYPFSSSRPRSGYSKLLFHMLDIYNFSSSKSLKKVIDKEMPDIAVTHNLLGFSVSAWGVLTEKHIPIVHFLHDYYLTCPGSNLYHNGKGCTIMCDIFSTAKRRASSNVAAVIGVSEYVLNHHISNGYFKDASQHVIYNGQDLLGGKHQPREARQPVRFGFFGRVVPVKGIEVLLRAIALDPELPLELKVGGQGDLEYINYLKTNYPDRRVTYLGFQEPASFYKNIDVLVVPSVWNEPLPGVVYEPWEYGVAVIASTVGGIPEMIENKGVGWLCKPNDIHDLLGCLKIALNEVVNQNIDTEKIKNERYKYTPGEASQKLLEVLHNIF